jgi:BirA family transcriptional regulator, biotin operon repressor / biotin---[acetyl-CoA-carboxylase] ligase
MPVAPDAGMASLNRAAEALWPGMAAMLDARSAVQPAGFCVEVQRSVDSTNAELMRRVRTGQTEPLGTSPVLLVAAEQTAGRGRMGKTWVSQPGGSLTFSLLLRLQPVQWAGLSLAVGVTLAESLAQLLPTAVGEHLRLKWPNDLWLHDCKLAGVLVETAHMGAHPKDTGSARGIGGGSADGHLRTSAAPSACVVIGVGINIQTPTPVSSAPWTGVPPTGLAVHLEGLEPGQVLQAVAPALLRDVLVFEAEGFAAFADRFARRDALRGRPLVLSDGQQGNGNGVDEHGALQLLTAQGMHTVHSAEVSVRPAQERP